MSKIESNLLFDLPICNLVQKKRLLELLSNSFSNEQCCNSKNKIKTIINKQETLTRKESIKSNKYILIMRMNSKQKSPLTHKTILFMMMITLFSLITVECYFKRTQYHEQGLHGPKSYKFGYTSGDYKNPQERHEVSDGYGHVKGYYSYVDANGKHQVVHYEAHPKYGFKVYNYKSKAYNNGKRHYNS